MEAITHIGGDSATGIWEDMLMEADMLLLSGFMCSRAMDEEEEKALVLKSKRQEKEVIKNEKREYTRKKTEIVTKLCGKNFSGLEGNDDCELSTKIEEYKDKVDELEIAYMSKKDEVEYAEKEVKMSKETVDSLNVETNASRGKIKTMLGLFDTERWVEITDIQGLTILQIMKNHNTGKKLRFCISSGIEREVYESVQRIAKFLGIDEPSQGVLYELNDGVFARVSQEESLALGFQM